MREDDEEESGQREAGVRTASRGSVCQGGTFHFHPEGESGA